MMQGNFIIITFYIEMWGSNCEMEEITRKNKVPLACGFDNIRRTREDGSMWGGIYVQMVEIEMQIRGKLEREWKMGQKKSC